MPVQFRRNIYSSGNTLLFPTGKRCLVRSLGHDEKQGSFITVSDKPAHRIFAMEFNFTQSTAGL